MLKPIFLWVLLRIVTPLVVGGAVTQATWGNRFSDVFGPLVWSLFIVHLPATFAFKRTHLLDTGSFFCLIFGCGAVSQMSESQYVGNGREWAILIASYGMYAFLSFIGRIRADRAMSVRKSVSPGHVVAAVVFLVGAVIACGTSKTAVGLLFVPGLLVIPIILLLELVWPGEPP